MERCAPEEARHISLMPLPEASPEVIEVVLRRIRVYLAQVHHLDIPRQELAALRFTHPWLRGVEMREVILELEANWALMLPYGGLEGIEALDGLAAVRTVEDLAVLTARVLAWEALEHPEGSPLPC